MSKPELDIIRSPEAEAFLRSVTKGFYNQSFIGLWMFEVMGREWDELREWSEGMRTEIHPQTCTWSIAIWEWVYGFPPDETLTLEERRRRVLSRVFSAKPINPEVLRRGIEMASGTDAQVEDFTSPYGFSVTMDATNGPVQMDRALRYIYEAKPAHLSMSVKVIFPAIESTLRIGSAMGSNTFIAIPRKPDSYDFRNTLYTAWAAGTAAYIGIPQGPDRYAFQGELHMGGSAGAKAFIGVPQGPDTYDFHDTLYAGGAAGARPSVAVPQGPDHYTFKDTLCSGGVVDAQSSIGVAEEPDSYDFRDTLHTGGSMGAAASVSAPPGLNELPFSQTVRAGGRFSGHTSMPAPEDTLQPPTTTILRTGGVCTIISNLSSEEE